MTKTRGNVLARFIDRIARERFVIGRGDDAYLTRWTLLGQRLGGNRAVYLHRFHRGDHDDALHDHPWPFNSLILLGGYWEHTPDGRRTWYGPGSFLYRPARWRHRVELPPGRECWSLIYRGRKQKSWSFFCIDHAGRLTGKAVPWRSYLDSIDAGSLGCGDTP